jgi:photosystem II stability/assembly factor-like uncharacterized protein
MTKKWHLVVILLIGLMGCTLLNIENPSKFEEITTPIQIDPSPTDSPHPTSSPTIPSSITNTPTLEPTPTIPALPSTITRVPPFDPATPLISGQPITITQISMLSITTGWGIGHQSASGARILFTLDGGQTWLDRTPPDATANTPAETESSWAYFHDNQSAWVVFATQKSSSPPRDIVIWHTIDRGQTWEASNFLALDGLEAYFIPEGFAFSDPDHGWLLVHVGAGMSHDYSFLYHTTDGGAYWERIADPYGDGLQSLNNTGLAFPDSQLGWVSKDNLGVMAGAFFEQTLDGGATWEKTFLPPPPDHDWSTELSRCQTLSPTFTSPQTAILIVNCRLYGEDYNPDMEWSLTYIFSTTDRGQTWRQTKLNAPVRQLIFINTQVGWALGRELFQTIDGGLNWVGVKQVNWEGQFNFVDTTHGWAIARNNDEIALVTTQDGGRTWQILTPIVQ